MKTLLVSAGLMLASLGATAQNYFGVTAGYNLSTRNSDDVAIYPTGKIEYGCRSGFNAGIAYEHRFTASEKGYLFLDANLLYSLEGYHLKMDYIPSGVTVSSATVNGASSQIKEEVIKIDEDIDYKYLKVPVSFGYNFQLAEKFGLAPKVTAIFESQLKKKNDFVSGTRYANFAFGGGANLNIGERISIDLGYDWMPESFGGDHKCVYGNAHANFTYYIFSK